MAWESSGRSDESSLFSRGSSYVNRAEEQDSSSTSSDDEEISRRPFDRPQNATRQSRHFSFAEHQGESSADEADFESPTSSSVPAEQERQLLLLMLLAQVCALHDPTPRTFTVHVLELFERGILDRQSILFLFELGLVPSTTTSKLILPSQGDNAMTNSEHEGAETELSLVPSNLNPRQSGVRQRTAEASAIRNTLEREERQYRKSQSEPIPQQDASWQAKHHPLSLSRYQREFEQVCLLSSGAFGQVFQATNYMDGRDYAIKRIQFSATGYSQESVQQVIRECHCLAACNHPNVVRYYTSWLEPSWMTGSGASSVMDTDQHQKLLKDINHIVAGSSNDNAEEEEDSHTVSNKLQSYFTDQVSPRRPRRRYSFDASESEWGLEQSEWTVDDKQPSFSKDDLFAEDIFDRSSVDGNKLDIPRNKTYQRPKKQKQKYSYQICLFIQMQLCHPSTLADWIRERNKSGLYPSVSKRLGTVQEIFHQCVRGLAHCHENHIIHRDLKPANIFATLEGELQFKIGDFGLSKMIRTAMRSKQGRTRAGPLLLSSSEDWQDKRPSPCFQDETAKDPLTAGVGTASYASPEQVTSKKYDTKADIFSLGLILLELSCAFGTEHERYQVFHDCRQKRKVPEHVAEYPSLARTILVCTEPNPCDRPSCADLLNVDLLAKDSKSLSLVRRDSSALNTEALRQLLVEKDKRIHSLERQVIDRDQKILDLEAELSRLRSERDTGVFTYSGVEADVGETSSSSDDM